MVPPFTSATAFVFWESNFLANSSGKYLYYHNPLVSCFQMILTQLVQKCSHIPCADTLLPSAEHHPMLTMWALQGRGPLRPSQQRSDPI